MALGILVTLGILGALVSDSAPQWVSWAGLLVLIVACLLGFRHLDRQYHEDTDN